MNNKGSLKAQNVKTSLGNYTQYFVITYKGKESEKNIYVYIAESLCSTLETNTTL